LWRAPVTVAASGGRGAARYRFGMTQQPPVAMACYRHPDRGTYIACQRCGRPICGDCMISAAVGFQCPECVREGARTTRQGQLPYGGRPSSNPSATTIALIAINVAVWALLNYALRGDGLMLGIFSLNPGLVGIGFWWQPLTSAFVHQEILHLGVNMLSLWFLGPSLERALGRARFLAVYLISALVGSAAVMWFSDPSTFTLGASGAIFGLIGSLLVIVLKIRGDVRNVLVWLGINLVFTFVNSGISWQAHIGGLLGGLLTTAVIVYAPRDNRTRLQLAGLVGALLAAIVLIGVRALALA
jgi:membrane associated rhomboid family serine protease